MQALPALSEGVDASTLMQKAPSELFGWDLDRELRVLRDAGTRSRTEEANALRRSAEEVERCVVRRQLDEGDALQKFCSGFSGAMVAQLERQRLALMTRMDAVESSLNIQAERSERLRVEAAGDVRNVVCEAIEALCQLLGQHGDSTDARRPAEDDAANPLRRVVARLNSEMRTSFAGIAERAAVGHLGVAALRMTDDLNQFRDEIRGELCGRCDDLQVSLSNCKEQLDQMDSQFRKLEALESVSSTTASKLDDMTKAADALQAHLSAVDDSTVVLKEAVRVCATEVRNATRAAEDHAAMEARAALGAASQELQGAKQEMQESLAHVQQQACGAAAEAGSRALSAEQMVQGIRGNLVQEVQTALRYGLESSTSDMKARLTSALEAPLEASLRTSLAGAMDSRASQLLMECKMLVKEAAAPLEADSGRLNKQMQDLSAEVMASHGAAEDVAKAVHRLSSDLLEIKGHVQAPAHTWTVQQCMRRLRSLSLAGEPGVWLDSPEFSLGPWPVACLQLYPRGLRGTDGQVAVGVLCRAGPRRPPRWQTVRMDVTVQTSIRRAEFRGEDEAGTLFVASGLGPLESLLAQVEDLAVTVELLPGWASEASGASSSSAEAVNGGAQSMESKGPGITGSLPSSASSSRKAGLPPGAIDQPWAGSTSPVQGSLKPAMEVPKARPVSARASDLGSSAAIAAAASAAGVSAQRRGLTSPVAAGVSPQAAQTPWSSPPAGSPSAAPAAATSSWSGAIFDGFRRSNKEAQAAEAPPLGGPPSKNPFVEESPAPKAATPHSAAQLTLSTNPFDDPAH